MSQDKTVRAIADILWQFHNDRLKDPSITDLAPYIRPIKQLMADEVAAAIETLTSLDMQRLLK